MRSNPSLHKRILLLSGVLLAFLLILGVSTYTLYDHARTYLDNELGERLESASVLMAHLVESVGLERGDTLAVAPEAYALLGLAKAENELSNIVILTEKGETVLDLSGFSIEGEYNPFVDLDFSAFMLARSGFPAATKLYKSEGLYLKSAYAPIRDRDGRITGVLGVEAGAAYFEVLGQLRRAITVVDSVSVVLILLLGYIFHRQTLSLERAREAAVRGENLAAMGRMAAGIAHELRNPLSIIKTSAERIRKRHGIEDETLSYIIEEVDELNRILSGYLSFARAERAELATHSLTRIARRCLLGIEAEAASKSVHLTSDIPQAEIMVKCDDKRIQQALMNGLINAVQAVGKGGTVKLSLSASGGQAKLLIEDDGCGIEEKDLGEIAKPFYTTKQDGSGLGLSILDNIVRDHGGSWRVDSAVGEGTKLEILLPVEREPTRSE